MMTKYAHHLGVDWRILCPDFNGGGVYEAVPTFLNKLFLLTSFFFLLIYSFKVHILKCRIILSRGLTWLLLATSMISGWSSSSRSCSWLTRGWTGNGCGGRRWGCRRWRWWRGTTRGCCGRCCCLVMRTLLLTRNSEKKL